jgi:hypothetical protein
LSLFDLDGVVGGLAINQLDEGIDAAAAGRKSRRL